MTPEQWKALDDLFDEARSLPAPAQDAFARDRCAHDTTLRHELLTLLRADRSAGLLLEQPIANVSPLIEAADGVDPLIGARLGSYTVESVLGQGGMGVVYRARQDSPRRIVALKVVRPGAIGGMALRRFQHEAEVLGRLQHPGIAQIHESGRAQTPLGTQPFFAMELVEGRPLLDYAKKNGLSVRQRLELFARVCDAVQFAHLKGVIHRDLKPGNILVDERGQPKILDFGIARITGSDIRAVTIQTDIGQLIGTVPYMSPEQAAGNPRNLDTRSDVYALGVVLYELLSGKLPYELREVPVTQAVRVISEQDPTRLSTLSRGFRGDVETIVAKALEKDKARRYQSAADLGADLRRYLADQAISARPPSTAYQLRKFAHRNKALVGGVIAAFILLVAGVIGTGIGMARAVRSEGIAKAEAAKARTEASKARHAVTFLQDMLAAANPEVAQGRELTVHDLLDEAAAGVESELKDDAAVRAAVQETLGRAYLSTGDLAKARERLERSLEDYRSVGGDESEDVARGLGHLASLHAAGGDRKAALEQAELSLAMYRRLANEEEVASAQIDVGMYQSQLNQYPEAERNLTEAIATYERLQGRRSRSAANALDLLGQVHIGKGDFDKGVAVLKESADIKREVAGPFSPALGYALKNLSAALQNQGKPAEAEPIIRECVEIRRKIYGSEHAEVASALVSQGLIFNELDRYGDAEGCMLEALATRRKILQAGHIDIANSVHALGKLCALLHRYGEAVAYYKEALEIRRAKLGEHRLTAQSLEDLGAAMSASGDAPGGEALAQESLALRKKLLGPDSPMVARTLAILATTRAEQKDYTGADALFVECMAILDKRKIAPTHPTRLSFAVEHAAVMHKLGRNQEAGALLLEAIRTLRDGDSGGSTDLAKALDRRAELLKDTGDVQGARGAWNEAMGIYEAKFGAGHAITEKVRGKLAEIGGK